MIKDSKKLVILALFLSIGIILNIVENITPSIFVIPGIKLGLANTISIFILSYYSYKEMFIINIFRIILANIILGGLFSTGFMISFGSSITSMLLLIFFIRIKKLSIYGISMIQAFFFNIFQVIIVSFLYSNLVFLYILPYLMLSAIITGLLVAFISKKALLLLMYHLKQA